jgi:nitronate monooxygenase
MASDRIKSLLGIELPIIQAPMAGANYGDMAVAVSNSGGLGSLPCATLDATLMRSEMEFVRSHTSRPWNVNFFCHEPAPYDEAREMAWRERMSAYYAEFGIDPNGAFPTSSRTPFDETLCALVEEFRPPVVSFHFGLPPPALLARVKAAGAVVLSSATTVDEAVWLEERGCDAVIAQGAEAGGHRGMFLPGELSAQPGTMALVPQVVDALRVPVIAAGGIGDARGIRAALALGADAVQLGTAYLFCPEARISAPYREALRNARDNQTTLTNLFTGKPARGLLNRVMREVGPLSPLAPQFPLAGGALLPLKAAAEKQGRGEFSSLWAGQAARLGRTVPAAELTLALAREAGLAP